MDLEKLRRMLMRIVTKRCPRWSREVIEEVVQEALIKIHRHLERQGEAYELPGSYLYKTAHSAICDEVRRVRRRQEVMAGDDLNAVDTSPLPATRVRDREIRAGLEACLQEMTETRRRPVMLRLMGYSIPEIAGLLQFKVKRAENLVYRGLEDLRGCLASKEIEP